MQQASLSLNLKPIEFLLGDFGSCQRALSTFQHHQYTKWKNVFVKMAFIPPAEFQRLIGAIKSWAFSSNIVSVVFTVYKSLYLTKNNELKTET